MKIFALQSLVGGFLDEDLKNFNKVFDDWCVQFECMEDAQLILDTLDNNAQIKIVANKGSGDANAIIISSSL